MAHSIEVLDSEPFQNLISLCLDHLLEVFFCVFALLYFGFEQLFKVMEAFENGLVTGLLTRSVVHRFSDNFLFNLLIVIFQSFER